MKSTLALRTFLVTLFLRRQVVVIRSILAPDSGQVTKKISHAQPHHQLLNGPALIWFVYHCDHRTNHWVRSWHLLASCDRWWPRQTPLTALQWPPEGIKIDMQNGIMHTVHTRYYTRISAVYRKNGEISSFYLVNKGYFEYVEKQAKVSHIFLFL